MLHMRNSPASCASLEPLRAVSGGHGSTFYYFLEPSNKKGLGIAYWRPPACTRVSTSRPPPSPRREFLSVSVSCRWRYIDCVALLHRGLRRVPLRVSRVGHISCVEYVSMSPPTPASDPNPNTVTSCDEWPASAGGAASPFFSAFFCSLVPGYVAVGCVSAGYVSVAVTSARPSRLPMAGVGTTLRGHQCINDP